MKTSLLVDELIRTHALLPHPEGGFFRETYRSSEQVVLPRGSRSVCTAIYFLLTKGSKSRLHRIQSDELWHFYSGDPLMIAEITRSGEIRETRLGPGGVFQAVVPAGSWFGAYPLGEYTLVGCTVSPGFDFKDFEMGEREALLREFPRASELIAELA